MRKILLGVWGALVALFGLFGVQLNLVTDINEVGLVASLLVIGVWLFVEFKQDWADFKANVAQTNQWSDPAFWVTAIYSVVIPVATLVAPSLVVPETIVSVVALILSVVIPLFVKPTSPVSTRKLIRK